MSVLYSQLVSAAFEWPKKSDITSELKYELMIQ